jgi:hypothetical protein
VNQEADKDWGIVTGPWGDVICELGYVQHCGAKNVLYFGPENPIMISFLQSQKWIDRVEFIASKDRHHYHSINHLLMYGGSFYRGMEKLLMEHSLKPEQFHPTTTVMDANHKWDKSVPIAKALDLPEECHKWAHEIASQIDGDFFIIQPYSINSTTMPAHWPHWHELIQWLAGDFGNNYVLAGVGWNSGVYPSMSHFHNMVDKFPSVCHLFALAMRSRGVITTSNSLAHWCASQDIPATVMMNVISSEPTYFFNKVIQGEHIQSFTYYASLQRVCFALHERWGIWPAEA